MFSTIYFSYIFIYQSMCICTVVYIIYTPGRYNNKLYIYNTSERKKNFSSKANIQFPSPITHYPLHTTRTKGSDLIIIKDFRKVHVFHTLWINIIIRTCRCCFFLLTVLLVLATPPKKKTEAYHIFMLYTCYGIGVSIG